MVDVNPQFVILQRSRSFRRADSLHFSRDWSLQNGEEWLPIRARNRCLMCSVQSIKLTNNHRVASDVWGRSLCPAMPSHPSLLRVIVMIRRVDFVYRHGKHQWFLILNISDGDSGYSSNNNVVITTVVVYRVVGDWDIQSQSMGERKPSLLVDDFSTYYHSCLEQHKHHQPLMNHSLTIVDQPLLLMTHPFLLITHLLLLIHHLLSLIHHH